ncbi:hypothetical protein [Adhaeretor mobilis]|uniref:Uncharacterized protein n=1 Tax=Adhaeretor mobilis TaxID=1930276 RepID=A0A517MQX1_9BACT|nr:hypothetical protein [Adhaeretor mobilis]QDS97284.1 hypothetical protein HG15A2_05450 [Adhaeretor mobilis]
MMMSSLQLAFLDFISPELRASLMFLAGIALVTVILVRHTYRRIGRGRTQLTGGRGAAIESQPRPVNAWDGSFRDATATVERQKVELHEFARDANGLLTSKIAMLEQLIATSGEQIEHMERLLAELREAQQEPYTSGKR